MSHHNNDLLLNIDKLKDKHNSRRISLHVLVCYNYPTATSPSGFRTQTNGSHYSVANSTLFYADLRVLSLSAILRS